jgi:hypothetical protein
VVELPLPCAAPMAMEFEREEEDERNSVNLVRANYSMV